MTSSLRAGWDPACEKQSRDLGLPSLDGLLQRRDGLVAGRRRRAVRGADGVVNLLAVHLDLTRRVHAEADDVALDLENAQDDVVPDDEALADPARQYQHRTSIGGGRGARPGGAPGRGRPRSREWRGGGAAAAPGGPTPGGGAGRAARAPRQDRRRRSPR